MESPLDRNSLLQFISLSQKEIEILHIFENCCRSFSRLIPLFNQDPNSMDDLFSGIEVMKTKNLKNEKVINQIFDKQNDEKTKLQDEIFSLNILQKENITKIKFLNSQIEQNKSEYEKTLLQVKKEKIDLQNKNDYLNHKLNENDNDKKMLERNLIDEKQKNEKEQKKCNNLEEKMQKMEEEHGEALESKHIQSIQLTKINTQLINQVNKLEEKSKEIKDQNIELSHHIQEKEALLNRTINDLVKDNLIDAYEIKLQKLSEEKQLLVEMKEKNEDKINDTNGKLKEIEEKFSSLHKTCVFLETRLKNLITQNEELSHEKNGIINDLEKQNNILITENALLKNEKSSAEFSFNEESKGDNMKMDKIKILNDNPDEINDVNPYTSILKNNNDEEFDPKNIVIKNSEDKFPPEPPIHEQDADFNTPKEKENPTEAAKEKIDISQEESKISYSEEENKKSVEVTETEGKVDLDFKQNKIEVKHSVELKDNAEASCVSSRIGSSTYIFPNPNARDNELEDFESNCSSEHGSKIRKVNEGFNDFKNIDSLNESLQNEKEIKEEKENEFETPGKVKRNISSQKGTEEHTFVESVAVQEQELESQENRFNLKSNGALKGKPKAPILKSHFANELMDSQPNKVLDSFELQFNQIYEGEKMFIGGKSFCLGKKISGNSINNCMYKDEEFKDKETSGIYNNIETRNDIEPKFIEEKEINNDEEYNALPNCCANNDQSKHLEFSFNESFKISQNVKNIESVLLQLRPKMKFCPSSFAIMESYLDDSRQQSQLSINSDGSIIFKMTHLKDVEKKFLILNPSMHDSNEKEQDQDKSEDSHSKNTSHHELKIPLNLISSSLSNALLEDPNNFMIHSLNHLSEMKLSSSPIRSAFKKGTLFQNTDSIYKAESKEEIERKFQKKRTIKFGQNDQIKIFQQQKEETLKEENGTLDKELSHTDSKIFSKAASCSSSKSLKEETERKKDTFGKQMTVLMIINIFLKNLKLKSGRFGSLGQKQLKFLNDLAVDREAEEGRAEYEMETNLMARMIKKFRETQKKRQYHFIISIRNFFKTAFDMFKGDFGILLPNQNIKLITNFLVFCVTLTEFIYVPFETCFSLYDISTYWYVRSRIFIHIFLLFEIILNFNTGYFNKGMLILERIDVIKNYIYIRFWFDLATILPLFLNHFYFYSNDDDFKFCQFIFLLRIFNLNEMIRKICDFYDAGGLTNSVIGLLKLTILILYVAHICACLWHYISVIDSKTYQTTWISVFQENEEDQSLSNEYITSLYWAVTTMITVGYGDIIPRTPNEKIFAITSMLVACCVFAYIMNSIGIVINSFNARQAILRHKIQAVNKYLDMKNIDYDLRIRIRKYLEYLYEEKNSLVREGQIVIMNLSTALKTEIFQRLNTEILGKIPILIKVFTPKLLLQVASFMKEVSYTPEDIIFSANDISNQDLFYIYEGQVEIFIENFSGFKDDTKLTWIEKGGFFGEICFFSNQPRSASAKSLGFSNLISLSREDFLNVIRNFSYDYEKFCMISDNINLYKNYYSLFIKCFCCNFHNHLSIDCPMVHVSLNKERIIRLHILSEPVEREAKVRSRNVKFKSLKNLPKIINAVIKLHRTNTFEVLNESTSPEEEEEDNTQEEKNNYIGRNFRPRNKVKEPSFSPYAHNKNQQLIRKSKSYTNRHSDNLTVKINNTIINENKDSYSKDHTNNNEIRLFTSNPQWAASSSRSLLSPTIVAGNPQTYVSLTRMSSIEKKQETNFGEVSALENFSPSYGGGGYPTITTTYGDPFLTKGITSNFNESENMDYSENESEEDESMISSVVPQRSRISKKSEIIINSVPSVQNNPHTSSLNIRQTNVNINYNCKIKDDKKRDLLNFVPNFAFFTLNEKEDFDMNFERMKIFDAYFIHNNVNYVLEEHKRFQIKNRKNFRKTKSQGGLLCKKRLSVLVKNLPLFKKKTSILMNEENNLGDGKFLKRRQSEGISLAKSKTLNMLQSKLTIQKKSFWRCSCFKKKEGEKEAIKRKQTLLSRRVSITERMRRGSYVDD